MHTGRPLRSHPILLQAKDRSPADPQEHEHSLFALPSGPLILVLSCLDDSKALWALFCTCRAAQAVKEDTWLQALWLARHRSLHAFRLAARSPQGSEPLMLTLLSLPDLFPHDRRDPIEHLTPLHFSASANFSHAVRHLLEHGANADVRDAHGE